MTLPVFTGLQTAAGSNGTQLDFNRATLVTGNLNEVHVYIEGVHGALVFANGAWTVTQTIVQVGSNPDYTHYRAREIYAGAGEACSITWGGQTVWRAAICQGYSGVNGTTPIDATPTSEVSASNSNTVNAPSATVTTPDAMAVWGEADFQARTVTGPTGWVERSDFDALQTAELGFAAAGATGPQTATLSGVGWNDGSIVVYRPAVPGGGAPVSIAPAPQAVPIGLVAVAVGIGREVAVAPLAVPVGVVAPAVALETLVQLAPLAVPIGAVMPVVSGTTGLEPAPIALVLLVVNPSVSTGAEVAADAVDLQYYTYVADDGSQWAVKVDRTWGEHPDSGATTWVSGLPTLTKRSNGQARRIVLQDLVSGRWTTRVVFTPTAAAWITPGYSTQIPIRGAGGLVGVSLVERKPEHLPRPHAIAHKPQPIT